MFAKLGDLFLKQWDTKDEKDKSLNNIEEAKGVL